MSRCSNPECCGAVAAPVVRTYAVGVRQMLSVPSTPGFQRITRSTWKLSAFDASDAITQAMLLAGPVRATVLSVEPWDAARHEAQSPFDGIADG